LTKAYLIRPNLTSANFCFSNLTDANLTGANLTEALLDSANLTGTNLTEAVLDSANLTGANLTGANLDGANLNGANLTNANLTNVILSDYTNFRDATLRNIRGLNLNSIPQFLRQLFINQQNNQQRNKSNRIVVSKNVLNG